MCGICGFVNLRGQPIEEGVGRRMEELLSHRGPDGEGRVVRNSGVGRPSVFLGHRRLKIIDLSEAARQPLPNEDETIWVIFNGEIYNFVDLRSELEARGHVFRSRSDTETIVHAYEEFGDGFVQHLDGMFAFALWDDRQGRLILARDRSGKKPLFYAFNGRTLTFASEIKALLACPWVETGIAVDRIPEYLRLGYVLAPATLYRGILQVPAGSYLVVDGEDLQVPHRYWELSFVETPREHRPSSAAATNGVRELLIQAVARRLISDVPLGALLSGGLDSSIIVGIMSRLLREPVKTFTIGFADDLSYDERAYAAIAARHFGTEHTEYVVRTDTLALMEHLLWHHDQPYGDSSAIPTYIVCKIARQHVTVALNGDGGDEVFAGYGRFLAGLVAERLPRFFSAVGGALARRLRDGHGYYSARRRLKRFFEDAHLPLQQRFIGWMALFDRRGVAELLRPEVAAAESARADDRVNDWAARTYGLPALNQLLYLNFITYLPDDLHVKMDRMSMANSLETRSPMLDTTLVEFVATLPPALKIRRGEAKYILKAAFRDLLPRVLLERSKHGLSVPLGSWFRHKHRSYVEEVLLAGDARLREYLNHEAVRRLVGEHAEGSRDRGHQLWALLNFELWLRMLESGELTVPRKPHEDGFLDIAVATGGGHA